MMNKKASINLSINMIIVLIIGIVILGLALGFVNGMFNTLEKQFAEKISAEPEAPTPNSAQPVTLSSEMKVLDIQEPAVYKIKIKNPTETDWTGVVPKITCGSTPWNFDGVQVNSKNIDSGDVAEYLYMFTVPQRAAGDYLCKASAHNSSGDTGFYKEFSIRING